MRNIKAKKICRIRRVRAHSDFFLIFEIHIQNLNFPIILLFHFSKMLCEININIKKERICLVLCVVFSYTYVINVQLVTYGI